MAKVLIVCGTVTGNAEDVAVALKDWLVAKGCEVELPDMASYAHFEQPWDAALVCTATTGAGDLPDDLEHVALSLEHQPPRALAGLPYGVIGLGDRSYQDTFCQAGATIDQLLESLGAQPVMARLELDMSEQGFDGLVPRSLEWIEDWYQGLLSRLG